MSYKNYVGQHIGELDVLDDLGINDKGRHIWNCKCSCGNECIKTSDSLRDTKHPSCNKCFWDKKYIGKTYGRLTVLDEYMKPTDHGNIRMAICECSCENHTIKHVKMAELKYGSIVSCGCYKREKNKHYKYMDERTYNSWHGMMLRCYYPKSPRYSQYGGRGIKVCERWHDYDNFCEDMGKRPEGLTLNRKDNDKDYCLENCEWTDKYTQMNNMSKNVYYDYEGEQKTLAEIARTNEIPYKSLWHQVHYNKLTVVDAVEKVKDMYKEQ